MTGSGQGRGAELLVPFGTGGAGNRQRQDGGAQVVPLPVAHRSSPRTSES